MGSQSPDVDSPNPSLSPNPSPTSSRPVGALMFRPPVEDDLEEGAGSPSLSGEPSEPQADPLSDAPRTSTGSSAGSATSKRVLVEAVRQGVLIAGNMAHGVLARDDVDRASGIWLASEHDAEAIGEPLANIAHRRGGIGAAGNPDIADAISALIGLALYAARQVGIWRANRDYRAQMGGGPVNGPENGHGEPVDL